MPLERFKSRDNLRVFINYGVLSGEGQANKMLIEHLLMTFVILLGGSMLVCFVNCWDARSDLTVT